MTTVITLHLYENGTLDCWVQEPGGPVVSFDPDQIPARMASTMDTATTTALADLAAKKLELAAITADLAAKDAELAAALAERDAANAKVVEMEQAQESAEVKGEDEAKPAEPE